jgi:hypothetical protein
MYSETDENEIRPLVDWKLQAKIEKKQERKAFKNFVLLLFRLCIPSAVTRGLWISSIFAAAVILSFVSPIALQASALITPVQIFTMNSAT